MKSSLTAPLARGCWLVAVLTAAWCMVAVPARATYGARTTGDEPHYLVTALSLAEDHDLDVRDELVERRWREFHEAPLPVQSAPRDGGQMLIPHDPLLPIVLAAPMGLGGWVMAKMSLALIAGALAAALVWVAHRRFAVRLGVAVPVVLAFSLAAPLAAYGTQVYPELPAALATTVAIAAVTGSMRPRALWWFAISVVALPWLSVKYVPVAVALAAVAAGRLVHRSERRSLVRLLGGLTVSAVLFLWVHKAVYGGWTVYAAGDHFVDGELTVMGSDPDYFGRAQRLLGLLVDRDFGLVAWAPVWLIVLPAATALLRRRPPGWIALVLPLAAGWLTATFVAQTMHGWWWPGRQTVVVLPCLVLMTCWYAGLANWARNAVVVLGALSALTWAWVVAQVLRLDLRLVIDFADTTAPVHRMVRSVLPDMADPTGADWARYGVWIVVVAGLLVLGWRAPTSTRPHQEDPDDHPTTPHDHPVGRVPVGVHRGMQ